VIDAFFDLADTIITVRSMIRKAWTSTAGTPSNTPPLMITYLRAL
jgi:hypothetical protein